MKPTFSELLSQLTNVLTLNGVDLRDVVIGGSGILGVLNLRIPRDLDVWLPDSAPDIESTETLELFKGPWMVGDVDFSLREEEPTRYGYYTFWSPEKTLRWKKAMNRPKDQDDIFLLERHIRNKKGPKLEMKMETRIEQVQVMELQMGMDPLPMLLADRMSKAAGKSNWAELYRLADLYDEVSGNGHEFDEGYMPLVLGSKSRM